MIVALPTNDGRTLTIVFFPNDAFHEVRADNEELQIDVLKEAGCDKWSLDKMTGSKAERASQAI